MVCHSGMKGLRRLFKTIIVFAAACATLCAFSLAVDATVVDASSLNIRTETNTECDVVTKVKSGTTLEVVAKLDDWYAVVYGEDTGFVSGKYLEFAPGVEVNNSLGTVTGSSVNVRSGADTDYPVVTRLLMNTYVNVLGYTDGWYEISYQDYVGYISADYLAVNGIVYTFSEEKAAETAKVSTLRDAIVAYAKTFLGVKYVYGGSNPDTGFDCSGFTQYVYKHFGYSLNRTSSAQTKNGTAISKSELKIGDLVFFSRGSAAVGHVGIYIGDGEFIHATSPGDDVSIDPLSMNYYATRYAGARRIIED